MLNDLSTPLGLLETRRTVAEGMAVLSVESRGIAWGTRACR